MLLTLIVLVLVIAVVGGLVAWVVSYFTTQHKVKARANDTFEHKIKPLYEKLCEEMQLFIGLEEQPAEPLPKDAPAAG